MSVKEITSGVTVKDIDGKFCLSQMFYTPSSHREQRLVLDLNAEERLLSVLLSRKASRNSGTDQMFCVQLSVFNSPDGNGDFAVVQLLNPDGTVCIERAFAAGEEGFTAATESMMTDFVANEARDFMEVYFDAVAERLQRF